MTTQKITDYLLGIVTFVIVMIFVGIECYTAPCKDIAILVAGALAIAYVVHFLYFLLVKKIQRDVILVKKNYWCWILLLVVSIPLVFAGSMVLLGIPNSHLVFDGEPHSESVLWSVFFHYIDPGNTHMTAGEGKIVASIIALLGIVLFNGLLVSTILNWSSRRKEQWDNGEIRYPLSSFPKYRYAIVIGANEMAASVIKELLQPATQDKLLDSAGMQSNDYVILHTSSDVPEVREQLSAQLTDDEMNRVICYRGLRNSKKEIEHLHLPYASCVYILGESTVGIVAETSHDALNMNALNLMAQILAEHKKTVGEQYQKKDVHVLFDYHTTSSMFQFSDISSDVKDTILFSPFDTYETWARRLLVDNQAYNAGNPIYYTPLDGYDGIRAEDNKRVHLVIIGMSKMGVALAEQTLYQAHYLNHDKQRTRITFIDSMADKQMEFFVGGHSVLFELMRYRYVDANQSLDEPWIDPMTDANCRWKHLSDAGRNFIDVEVEFVKGDVESDPIRSYLRQIASDAQSKLTIAVCLHHTNQALAASLYMPLEVYESEQLQNIWVYQRDAVDIVDNLTKNTNAAASRRYLKLRPFGMVAGERMGNQLARYKAMLVNRTYDLMSGEPWPKDMFDASDEALQKTLTSWDQLEVKLKWSNFIFVDTIYQKLRGIYMPTVLQQLLAADLDDANRSEQLHQAAIIGRYHHEMFADPNWQSRIEAAIEQNKDALMTTEHNRWNMEKLMVGISPCQKQDDDLLRQLIQDKNLADQEGRTEDAAKAKAAQKDLKNALKQSAAYVHPNICDFDHLEITDPGSKDYDIKLCRAIPRILMMVDGYGMCKYQPKK